VDDAVLCIHLEGPFISPEDGPRGAHPAGHVQRASLAVFDQLNAAAGQRIGIVTLAPEVPGAMDLIAELSARGIVVALGHTGATRSQVREAALMGATLSTHLGNGAHAELPRHDNYLWEQLAADELWASFIPDGHHLPGSVLKAMIRAKGLTRSILVSDAIFAAGMEPGRYAFAGQEIDLLESGRVNLAGTPYLAGSGLSLPDGVARCHGLTGLPLVDCWAMASENPLRLLGFRRAQRRLMPGFPARHIVRADTREGLATASVVCGG
jgi:N-acetylglucosamine-6-phosphate deacetylase